MRNLLMVRNDLAGWEEAMRTELSVKKFVGAHVRIHDGGDFFSEDYLRAWLRIIQSTPGTTFYCYTKEVKRFNSIVRPLGLNNFSYVFSYGGRQDGQIVEGDRRCDVFPSEELLTVAGFHDQGASDLLAIYGPAEVGIVVNNHPGAIKSMGGKSLRELQASRHSED